MNSLENRYDTYHVIRELCRLLEHLSEVQKTAFLREVLRTDLDTYILKLILEMPQRQQLALLQHLERMAQEKATEEDSVLELNVDERRGFRKPTNFYVELSVGEESFTEPVQDISMGGAFIKTCHEVHIGQEITLSFSLPENGLTFTMQGKIVRCTEAGIGVQFLHMTNQQRKIIQKLMENT